MVTVYANATREVDYHNSEMRDINPDVYNQDNYRSDIAIEFDISAYGGNVSSCILHVKTENDSVIDHEHGDKLYVKCATENVNLATMPFSNFPPSMTSSYKTLDESLGDYKWHTIDITSLVDTSLDTLMVWMYPTYPTGDITWDIKFEIYSAGSSYPPYIELTTVGTEYDNIYVDPVNGSDTNAGTLAYPLASLSLAASRVNANGTVNIKAGSVWSPSAGQIGPTNKPVTYCVY